MRSFKPFSDSFNKRNIISSCLLWTAALILLLSYHHWGPTLISDIYYQRSFSFLNGLFEGRDGHSLDFYYAKSARLIYTTVSILLSLSLLPYFFAYATHSRKTLPKTYYGTDISLTAGLMALCLVFIVSIIPLNSVVYVPLLDYPFHIARAYILNFWSDIPSLQDRYDIQSFILPNMGMDLSLLLLGKFLSIDAAGRVFVSLTFGIMLGGCMFLYTRLYKHLSLWPLVSSFFLFNGILLLGFVNYLFGIGLLLWAIGLWIQIGHMHPWVRFLIGTLAATALFFAHLVALGLYAIVVAGYELQRSAGTFRRSARNAATDLAVGAAIFLLPLLLFLISSTAGEAESGISYAKPFVWKKLIALDSLLSGNSLVNLLQLTLIALYLLIVILHGRLQIARPMYLALTFLVISYLLLPSQALSGGLLDYRIPIAIAVITIGCTRLELRSRAWHQVAIIGMAGFLILRSVVLSHSWKQDDKVIAEYREAFYELTSNSVLFVATGETSFRDTMRNLGKKTPVNHLGSLATIEQGAFVPAIYAHPSQQPITVKNEYALIKAFQKEGPLRIKTAEQLERAIEEIRLLTNSPLFAEKDVYLLIHDPQHPPPVHTQMVVSGSRFSLLRVDKGP